MTETLPTPNSDLTLSEQTQEALDKLNVVNWNLSSILGTDQDIQMEVFAKRMQFTPSLLYTNAEEFKEALKEESMAEASLRQQVEDSMSKLGDSFQYQTLD
jgi:hypothetical protein